MGGQLGCHVHGLCFPVGFSYQYQVCWFAARLSVNLHNRVVVLGPCDVSRGAGLHLADEGGVVVRQNIQGL